MGRNPLKEREYKGYTIVPCSSITRDERWYVKLAADEAECPKFINLSSAMNYVDAIKTIEGLGK